MVPPNTRLSWSKPLCRYKAANDTIRPSVSARLPKDPSKRWPVRCSRQQQQPNDLPLPSQVLASPSLPGPKQPMAVQSSSTTPPRVAFPTPGHGRSRSLASVYTAFLSSTLVRHRGQPSFSELLFPPCDTLLFADRISVASEHQTGSSPILPFQTTFPSLKSYI